MGLTKDIGEVVATVLREGPDKHWGKDYYLSNEVLKMSEVAKNSFWCCWMRN